MQAAFAPVRGKGRIAADRVGDVRAVDRLTSEPMALPEAATLPRGTVGCAGLAGDLTSPVNLRHLTRILPQVPLPRSPCDPRLG